MIKNKILFEKIFRTPLNGTFIISLSLTINIIICSQSRTPDSALYNIKDKYDVVGMSVVVVKNDDIVFSKGYGLRDISGNLPVDDSTIYRIASISKFITSAALMKLYEKGLFNPDDDVSGFLGFTLRNPSFPEDTITFRKILSHTSSLRDGNGYDRFLMASYGDNPPPVLEDLLSAGGKYYNPDLFSSDKSPAMDYFNYANINFGVAGTLIERLSGRRFDIFCREEIFEPLGMTAGFNIQDLPDINNVAVLYRKSDSTWIPQADSYSGVKPSERNLSGYSVGSNGILFAPQGGLRVSPKDLSRFMIMIMNGGVFEGVRILGDSTISMIIEPQWTFSGSNGNNYYGIFNTYGLGANKTMDLLPSEILYGHSGEAYGLISDMYFSREKDYGIIFCTNGGEWGKGTYSGWYNIEEDIFRVCLNYIDSLTVGATDQPDSEMGSNSFQNSPDITDNPDN